MMLIGLVFSLILLLMGPYFPTPTAFNQGSAAGGVGRWLLEYDGPCSGRESESIAISQLDAAQMTFDGFHLRRNAAGQYEGSADFTASMPVDGRDIPYTIAYVLNRNEGGGFVGVESVTEGGGHALECPIALVFAGEE